jgi:protein-tyrosine phosphatase
MKTELLVITSVDDRESIRRAARLLREGAIVAFPTETVYGLGAKAEKSVLERLDQVKDRAMGKRYTLHIGDMEELSRYVPRPSLQARKLMRNVWPGPVTIIFEPDKESLIKVKNTLAPETYDLLYSDGTLGVRYPDNPVACAVLSEAVAPIIAPSANPASQRPAVSAQEAAAYFDGRIEMIIDTPQACTYRLNSTVVKAGGRLEVLREGVYSRDQILEAATVNLLFVCTGNTCRSPMAEALCRKYFADKFGCNLDAVGRFGYSIASAGVAAFEAMPASCHALEVGRLKETPLEHHRSRVLTEPMIRQADLIFVMNQSHLQAVIDAVPNAETKCFCLDKSGAIADPAGYGIDVYRACAEQIERCIQERMNELL